MTWIIHLGTTCPVDPDTRIIAEMKFYGSGDHVGPIPARDFDWDYPGDPVVRYKIIKPSQLDKTIELENTS